jgi:hypothetical protein
MLRNGKSSSPFKVGGSRELGNDCAPVFPQINSPKRMPSMMGVESPEIRTQDQDELESLKLKIQELEEAL